jgi:hypothetical protein
MKSLMKSTILKKMDQKLEQKLKEADTVRDMLTEFVQFYDLGKVRPGTMARVGIIQGLKSAVKILRLK